MTQSSSPAINFPGWPVTIRGRANLMVSLSGYGKTIKLHSGDALVVYRTRNSRVVILEYEVHGEATGYSRWFERPLAKLSFEVWIGDPAEIESKRVKKQKTDYRVLLSPKWFS